MAACRICGATLPEPGGRGRPRTRCESCAPSARRPLDQRPPEAGPERNDRLIAAATGELEAAGKLHSADGLVLLEIVERIASRRLSAMGLSQLAKAYAEQRALVFVDQQDDGEDVIAGLFRTDA